LGRFVVQCRYMSGCAGTKLKELVFFGPGEFVSVCVFSDVFGLFCLCGDGLYRRQQGAASDAGGQGQQACPEGPVGL